MQKKLQGQNGQGYYISIEISKDIYDDKLQVNALENKALIIQTKKSKQTNNVLFKVVKTQIFKDNCDF